MGGLIAFGAYKLSKRDVQRVEEYTGKDAEELSDQELEQAMDALDIEKQKRDDNDQEYNEQDQDNQQGSQGANQDQSEYLDELERLGKLRDEGYISQEEFDDKKKQLLGL